MFKYFHKGFQYLNFFGGTSKKKHPVDLIPVTEIINLRHLEWFQLASDVSNQRAQYYANIQKFSRNYIERCLRKCIFCPNGQIVEVCTAMLATMGKHTPPVLSLPPDLLGLTFYNIAGFYAFFRLLRC